MFDIEDKLQFFALLERTTKALEEQNTNFLTWTTYQKEQNEQVRGHERKMRDIQQESVDIYKQQLHAQEQQRAEELERLRSAHEALLAFFAVRNIKIVHAIDLLCERTALPKPDWLDLEQTQGKEE